MGVLIPTDEYQSNLLFALANDAEVMVTTLGSSDDIPGRLPQLVAEDVRSAAVAAGICTAANILAGWSFLGVRTYMGAPGGVVVGEALLTVVGVNNGQGVPNNCAMLVRKSTGLAGRTNRGRFYWPPAFFAEGFINQNGTLDPAIHTQWQTRMNSFHSELVSRGVNPALFHSATASSTPVTQFVADNRLATQRTRMR